MLHRHRNFMIPFATLALTAMLPGHTKGIEMQPPTTDSVQDSEQVLLNFDGAFDTAAIPQRDVTLALEPKKAGHALRLAFGHEQPWPGIDLVAPGGKWDLRDRQYVALDVTNAGQAAGSLCCRVDNPGADGVSNCNTGAIQLEPGASGTLRITFRRKSEAPEGLELVGMRAGPFNDAKGALLDPSNVTQLVIFVPKPDEAHTFVVDNIRAGGKFTVNFPPVPVDRFFPFIDEFGQYIHKDWPGKIHSLEELRGSIAEEERDLQAHPGPAERNVYGGWADGPELEATGWFRVSKHAGKWWLVDPEGRLFWSQGIDCVNTWAATGVSHREKYFRDLPADGDPLAQFYGKSWWAPHGLYKDHLPFRHYDFGRANLLRKYGEGWEEPFAALVHRRLRSWGLNTIANWSSRDIYLQRKTAYVATIHVKSPELAGSEGYWGKFRDVFDPAFREALAKRMKQEEGRAANDPWCIGFFVDNELSWGNDVSLATATLASPATQAAKRVFVADLRGKYGEVAKLNTAWGTAHASWDALLESQEAPDVKKAKADLHAFYTKTAETYFRTVRDEMKRVAPGQLYLGCRFAWVNDLAALAATKFCDVVSYNRYRYSVADHLLPNDVDMPTIVGEFHFGALDRGMFHTGLKQANSQEHRAQLYEEYVRGALRNPQIVGTHWFQFRDQATTGRGDGENYQIGFTTICDRPYPEIVAAARRLGRDMYGYRLQAAH